MVFEAMTNLTDAELSHLFSGARIDPADPQLHAALARFAVAEQRSKGWPATVTGRAGWVLKYRCGLSAAEIAALIDDAQTTGTAHDAA